MAIGASGIKYRAEDFIFAKNAGRYPAFIAGGVLRDAVFGLDARDVDLFVFVSEDDYESLKRDNLKLVAVENLYDRTVQYAIGSGTAPGYPVVPEVSGYEDEGGFVSCYVPDIPGLNIIVHPYPSGTIKAADELIKDVVSKFGCTLSMIWMVDGEIKVSNWFSWSHRNKCYAFSESCSDSYKDKIRAKFPDFTHTSLHGSDIALSFAEDKR